MNDLRLKHLEFLQAIIGRQAKNSSQAKSWAIVLLAGLAGLARGSKEEIIMISVGVVLLFWSLDSYYLSKERLFRNMYERSASQKKISLSLIPEESDQTALTSWVRCMFAVIEALPYGAMLSAILIISFRR